MIYHAYELIKEVFDYRDALRQLVVQNLTLRYRRTVMGYFWTLLNPLLMMTVMALVFANLFKVEIKTFVVFLFVGMIPWNFFNSVLSQSTGSLVFNEGIIKKVFIPKLLFPLSISIAMFLDAILAFAVLLPVIIFLGGPLSWSFLFLPISFILLFIFALGFGIVASIATVYFRDLQYIIVIGLQGLFFLTPILYKKEDMFGSISWLIELNPVTPFISLFREPLLSGVFPSVYLLLQSTALAFTSLLIGVYLFGKVKNKIVYRI
jgi:ABC-2 type transport system permease protein/lipopolysaccharide transport system permease protein